MIIHHYYEYIIILYLAYIFVLSIINRTSCHGLGLLSLPLVRKHTLTHSQSWLGHPYVDVVDNSTDFEHKVNRVIEKVCKGLGKRGVQLEVEDRLKAQSKKRKFLIKSLPDLQVSTCVYMLNKLYE